MTRRSHVPLLRFSNTPQCLVPAPAPVGREVASATYRMALEDRERDRSPTLLLYYYHPTTCDVVVHSILISATVPYHCPARALSHSTWNEVIDRRCPAPAHRLASDDYYHRWP